MSYKDLSYKIIGLAIQVRKELGFGFLEKVYENDLMILPEENQIILELKAQDRIVDIHKAQTLNYLRATNLRLAILLNFGKDRLDHERLVL